MIEQIQIVCYVEFFFLGLGILRLLFTLLYIDEAENNLKVMEDAELISKRDGTAASFILIAAYVIIGISLAISVWLAMNLYKGVRDRDHGKLRTWFMMTSFFFGLFLLLLVWAMTSNPLVFLFGAIPVAYRSWTLYVVRKFMKKIQEESALDGGELGAGAYDAGVKASNF